MGGRGRRSGEREDKGEGRKRSVAGGREGRRWSVTGRGGWRWSVVGGNGRGWCSAVGGSGRGKAVDDRGGKGIGRGRMEEKRERMK